MSASDSHNSHLLTLLIRRQEKFAANLFRAFSSGDFEGIAEGYQKIPPETKIFIFNVPHESEFVDVEIYLLVLRPQLHVFRRILLCCFLQGSYPCERKSV